MAPRPSFLRTLGAGSAMVIMSLAGAVEVGAQQVDLSKSNPAKLGVPGSDEARHLKEDAAKAAERAIEVSKSEGCVIRKTFLFPNKVEFTDEHCVEGSEKCTS